MTVKILKDCLTNYNSSCKVYISYGEGNKNPLTNKHRQPIETVGEMIGDLDSYSDENCPFYFATPNGLLKLSKIEQNGGSVIILADKIGAIVGVQV